MFKELNMSDKIINDIDAMFEKTGEGCVYGTVIKNTEKILIKKALKRSFGNQSIASKLLGINRNTLREKIKNMKIDARTFKI